MINPVNTRDKFFQYAVTVVLNHEEIEKHPQRITKMKTFMNKYNWEDIHFSSEKMIEKNKVTIALNILYFKKEKSIPY